MGGFDIDGCKAIEVEEDEAVSPRHQREERVVIEAKVCEDHANSSERTSNGGVCCNRVSGMSSYSPLQLGNLVDHTVILYLTSISECPH